MNVMDGRRTARQIDTRTPGSHWWCFTAGHAPPLCSWPRPARGAGQWASATRLFLRHAATNNTRCCDTRTSPGGECWRSTGAAFQHNHILLAHRLEFRLLNDAGHFYLSVGCFVSAQWCRKSGGWIGRDGDFAPSAHHRSPQSTRFVCGFFVCLNRRNGLARAASVRTAKDQRAALVLFTVMWKQFHYHDSRARSVIFT